MKTRNVLRRFAACALGCLSFGVSATTSELWTPISQDEFAAKSLSRTQEFFLDSEALKVLMDQAKIQSSREIYVPLPDGRIVTFVLTYDPILSPELEEQFPELRTYAGVQIDNPEHTGRFDLTPYGFHGMFHYQGKTVYVDPLKDQPGHYTAYYSKTNAEGRGDREDDVQPNYSARRGYAPRMEVQQATIQRIFRLIVSTSGEYTAFHGGTESAARSAITTAINRVNFVYQIDLAVRLNLVNFQIFTDAATDPFKDDDADVDIMTNHQSLISRFGSDAFDIGHLFTTGGGGLAWLEAVCDSDNKGHGLTGSPKPTGDSFYIDYVAHEIGHQFGASHTFNGTKHRCTDGNRNNPTAVEPGSSSTIMGYAGLCESDDLQSYSDAYFHAVSIDEIKNFLETVSCGSSQTLNNQNPEVNAGFDYTVPANTPLMLTGTASDSDSEDSITYAWEQMDAGIGNSNLEYDDGIGPLFRSWTPTTSAVRYLPRLQDLISGSLSKGETYATTSRQLNFRLTVRDGKGGVAHDDMKVKVTDNAGPFIVIFPTKKTTVAFSSLVEWNTAGTEQAPISCSAVDILFSNNDGSSFEQTLLSGTPNDGKQLVAFPSKDIDNARIMIKCSDNIFFALSEKFSVSKSGCSDGDTQTETSTTTFNDKSCGSISPAWAVLLLLFGLFRRQTK